MNIWKNKTVFSLGSYFICNDVILDMNAFLVIFNILLNFVSFKLEIK